MTFQYIVGPRKCGKSIAIENEMSKLPAKLYFGTLWLNDENAMSILEHRSRRDNTWHLIECSGSLNQDFIEISWLLTSLPIQAVLIDGLTTWAMNLILHGSPPRDITRSLCQQLLGIIEKWGNVDWYLINVTAHSYCDANTRKQRNITNAINSFFDCTNKGRFRTFTMHGEDV